ncbi:MAG: GIN domain-containing protein [Bacteroidota bacterium]
MRTNVIFLGLISIFAVFASCTESETQIEGEGNAQKKELAIDGFNAIHLDCDIDVEYSYGDHHSVILEAQKNLMEFVKVNVRDSRLYIDIPRDLSIRPTSDIVLHITMPEIRSITNNSTGDIHNKVAFENTERLSIILNGLGNITCHWQDAGRVIIDSDGSGNISTDGKAKEMYVQTNGTGNIKFSGESKNTRVEMNGSGNCNFTGSSDYYELILNGSGNFNAHSFLAENAEVINSGSGDAEVNVVDMLTVKMDGSGNVICHGDPVVRLENNGSGDFIKSNE